MKKQYRNAEKSKKAILDAFVELLEDKKSISLISVTELSGRANISKSTFYNHYSDIYEVAEEFEKELTDKLYNALAQMERDGVTSHKEYFYQVISFLRKNEHIYRCAVASSDTRFFIDKLKLLISRKIFENNPSLPFSADPQKRYVQIRFLTNAAVDTMVDYFKGSFDVPLETVADIIADYLKNI